jgi:hypothetical protein
LPSEDGLFAFPRGLEVLLPAFSLFILQGLVDLFGHDPGQSSIDLSLAIAGQSTVTVRDVVPEEE